MFEARTRIGAVLIGRNEGARLVAALASVVGHVERLVYVDSGSTDGSVAAAQNVGAIVVDLDLTRPFTAARARNEGVERLLAEGPLNYVQFVDGDCELQPGWIHSAQAFLDANSHVAVVHGRRRERYPEASIYNQICDWEWDVPEGEVLACGGDALMRVTALQQVGGYNPSLIAGEEPEMCVRLRQMGWQIHCIDHEMTSHDAAMTHLSQFWKRARRAGHAYAEGAALHGGPPEYHGVRGRNRALIWGLFIPLGLVGLAFVHPMFLLGLLAYPAQIARIALHSEDSQKAWIRAFFLILAKFPEAMGVCGHHVSRLRGRDATLIEYK